MRYTNPRLLYFTLLYSNLLLTMATAKVFAASNVRSGLMCRSALMMTVTFDLLTPELLPQLLLT